MEDEYKEALGHDDRERMQQEMLGLMGKLHSLKLKSKDAARERKAGIDKVQSEIEMLRLALTEGYVLKSRQMDIADEGHAVSVLSEARTPLSAKIRERRSRQDMPDDED